MIREEKFKAQDYTIGVRQVSDSLGISYEATIKEFGHTIRAVGKTPEEALSNAYLDLQEHLEDLINEGIVPPEPEKEIPWDAYSGKLTVRLPRSLHYQVHMHAQSEGVSINTAVVQLLSSSLNCIRNLHINLSQINFFQLNQLNTMQPQLRVGAEQSAISRSTHLAS